MAFQPLSVGDILMLSQTAWKIGRAFTHGRKSAPSEFAEVERESNGLSEALKLVAETLHSDGGILAQADNETKAAVNTILESARRTLSDLESFVERYQVIRKKETNGGFVVERGWSEVLMANYKVFKWTTEGGDITELRNMLNMHTNTINLTMQALQSKSLARLEQTVMPMADHVANIHGLVNGDLGDKIDDLHRLIMAVANSSPTLVAKDRAIGNTDGRASVATVSTVSSSGSHNSRLLEAPPPRSSSHYLPLRPADRRESNQSSKSTLVPNAKPGRRNDSTYYSMGPPETNGKVFELPPVNGAMSGAVSPNSCLGTSPRSGMLSPDMYLDRDRSRRESTTLPNLFFENGEPEASSSRRTPPTDDEYGPLDYSSQPVLPPPAITEKHDFRRPLPATPQSFFGSPKIGSPRTGSPMIGSPMIGSPKITSPKKEFPDNFNQLSTTASIRSQNTRSVKSPKIDSPQSGFDTPSFEKLLFRNSAILCDVRATLVEHAQKNPSEPDPRYDIEMVPAMTEGRVCVIRKREHREHGGTKVVTSVWSISDDGETRMQQKLSETLETVPYCSFFQPEKVSLPPTDKDISLKFHDRVWGEQLKNEMKTTWINYIFETEDDAIQFQSAVFGRMLIGSYRTNKSTVIHGSGLRGALAFEEQFSNIEMLRLWKDDGITMPGAAGGVMALMHVSSNYGEGWARWWMNNSTQQVRVKEDGTRHAKIKGLDMIIVKPGQQGAATAAATAAAESIKRRPTIASADGAPLQLVDTATEIYRSPGKKTPVKRVTGIRVEFKTEQEKLDFVSMSRILQSQMLPLPDL
ncbi:Hypothetical protein R9X50_00354700 [Acrodontium crateriforme]|uniref:Fungal N-terminal domain-containing protein n=1 Tax=Acrodontium crateriforme TaxID=150365 RepID=A0AAQ3M2R0_9PEZI|nr:Hypothetical protein R9X50_00354700 [Acrodontium crateriforme]